MTDTAAGGATEAVQGRLREMSAGRLYAIISRAIDGKFRLCVPPEPDDDDLILAALIDEALAGRAELVALRAVAAAQEAKFTVMREAMWDIASYADHKHHPDGAGAALTKVVTWAYEAMGAVNNLDAARQHAAPDPPGV